MGKLDDKPGHLARRFQQIAVSLFQEQVDAAGFDITPVQYATLAAIDAHPGLDQITLAGLIALDRTTMTGVIERLEQKDMVARRISSTDRRARLLKITKSGRETLERIGPAVSAAQASILSGLTPAEAEQLIGLLSKAVGALNAKSRAPLRSTARKVA